MLTQILIVKLLRTVIQLQFQIRADTHTRTQSNKRSVIRHTRMERATRDSAMTPQDRISGTSS